MSLAEQNTAHTQKIIAGVGPHIETLAMIADQIKLPTTARILREQCAALADDTFRLPVLGRFRNGKSTFLNALLCELTDPVPELAGAHGPLPVKDLPTTATLTTIDYGRVPSVTVVMREGQNEEWSLSRFRTEGVIRRDPAENERVFGRIAEFKLRFPSVTLKSGITILDTPGTDDIRERTEIVEALVNRIDAALVVLRSDALGGQDEREFIQSLAECGLTDLFFIVNRRDGRVADEDLKTEAWYRIVELCQGGPRYNGQDLAQRRIFFVDAKAALEGRLTNHRQKLAASGMETFERRLSEYLEKEKRPAHVRRFVQGADAQSRSLDDALLKLIPSVQSKADEFRAKYQAMQPQLGDIHKRVERLPRIIEGYRVRVEYALETSLRDLINTLCAELPAEMAKQKIPTVDDATILEKPTLPFKKKKIRAETETAAKSVYERRLARWRDNPPTEPGAQMVVNRLMTEMTAEIEEEIKGIKRQFDRIQFELTGFSPDLSDESQQASNWVKNALLGAFSVLYPDYGFAFAADGFRGLFRGILIHGAVGGIVVFLGGPLGWGIAAGMFANLLWTSLKAPEHLKERFRKEVCDALIPKLRLMPDQTKPHLAESLRKSFARLSTAVTAAVGQVVAKEEETLREQMETANKSAEEKRTLLAALQQFRKEVKKCREALQDTLIAVEAGQL